MVFMCVVVFMCVGVCGYVGMHVCGGSKESIKKKQRQDQH